MALDRKHETKVLEELKALLLKELRDSSTHETRDADLVSAEAAQAYAMIVQTQLALENS